MIKFHLLNHLVEDVNISGNKSVLDVSFYETLNVKIKKKFRGSLRTQATRMQKTATLLEQQKKVSKLECLVK